jgi:hypothetical protein
MQVRYRLTRSAVNTVEKALALTQQEREPAIPARADSAAKNKNLDDLSNSGAAVRLYGEGRATGPPESFRVLSYAKNLQIACRFSTTPFDA